VCGVLEIRNSGENKRIRVVTGSNRGKTKVFEIVNEVAKGDNHNEVFVCSLFNDAFSVSQTI
jgi:hypothetical protein